MPTREPAHSSSTQWHPQTATGKGPARCPQGRCPPNSVEAGEQGHLEGAGRVEAENGLPDPKGTSARLMGFGGLPDGVGGSSAPKLPKNSKQPPTTRAGRTSIKPLNALACRCKGEGWICFYLLYMVVRSTDSRVSLCTLS